MSDESIEGWIQRLNAGDSAAVEYVFRTYEPYLRIAIRRRLSRGLRVKVDSQDILQSVYADVLQGLRGGRWHFQDRAHLQAFLRRVAQRRLADRYQQHRKGIEREQPLQDGDAEALPDAVTPRPSEVAQGREFWDRLQQSCPPHHQEVVRLRMAGLNLHEIATRTGLHEGSIRRILYELARKLSIERGRTNPPRTPSTPLDTLSSESASAGDPPS